MNIDKEYLLAAFSDLLNKAIGSPESEDIAEVESDTKIVKSLHEMERRALFVVLEPQDSLDNVADLHRDYYDKETIEKACRSFNKHCMKAGLYHKYIVDSDLVEIEQTFITPSDFTLDDGRIVKSGSWLMWMHFPEPLDAEDDIWPHVLSGDFCGLSVGCTGIGVDLDG